MLKVAVTSSMLSSVISYKSGVSPSNVKPLDSLDLPDDPKIINANSTIDKALIVCIFGSVGFYCLI